MATADRARLRQKGPSDVEWDRIKPVFERLYIREGLTLRKISDILDQDYDFYAKPCMYKSRISKWGLQKNFKLEELEAVASTASHFVKAGLKFPTAIIGSREVPIERAKRHFKELFLVENQEQLSSGMMISPARSSQRSGLPACTSRDRKRRWNLQRRSAAIPRIFLQQSTESHHLESTLAAVNNYYGWRLTQGEDYFTIRMAERPIHPNNFINDVIYSLIAWYDGAYHVVQTSIRRFYSQAHLILLQQHPSLLEVLIYFRVNVYEGEQTSQLHHSVMSYLNAIAIRILAPDHPISMVLQLLACRIWQTTSFQLLAKLMCEIARRQEDSKTIFELEFDLAHASILRDDFDAASEMCGSLLQRCVDRFGETHDFSRRARYLLGYLNYRHGLNDDAEEMMLRVVNTDESSANDFENADAVTIDAMEILSWICEGKTEISEAKKWLSRAHVASCQAWGFDSIRAQRLLHRLIQVRRWSQGEDISDASEEDGAEILEYLERQLAQVALEETTEAESHAASAEPWNMWEKDIHCLSNKTGAARTRNGRDSSASTGIRTAEDDEEDLTAGGSGSCAALGPAVQDNSDSSQPSEEDEGEDHPSTHHPAQDSVHVEGAEAIFYEESQLPNFDVWDDAAAAAFAMMEDPLTFQFQEDMADLREYTEPMDADLFDPNELDMNSVGPFERMFEDVPMSLDVQNDYQLIYNHPQEQGGSPRPISTLVMEPTVAVGEQDVGSALVMDLFGFGDFDSTEMLDGTIDLPQMDVNMSEGIDTIDPKLVFRNNNGHGSTF